MVTEIDNVKFDSYTKTETSILREEGTKISLNLSSNTHILTYSSLFTNDLKNSNHSESWLSVTEF